MTTGHYRALVIGQIVTVCLLGVAAALIILDSVPEHRSRNHLEEAIESYSEGTAAGTRAANEALDAALAVDPQMRGALALRGRIGIEQRNPTTAHDAYKKLEQVLSSGGRGTARAQNGLGCALLLEAVLRKGGRAKYVQDAYEKFQSAIQQDPSNGDAHVNAAICCLHLGKLAEAAGHLEDARATRDLTYESLVAYYSAVGSMLTLAASEGEAVAGEVADKFGDPDPRLRRTGRMLFRAATEFDKAFELAQGEWTAAELQVNAAMVKARLLAWAPLGKYQANDYRDAVSDALKAHKDLFSRQQRQLLALVLANSRRKSGHWAVGLERVARAAKEGKFSPEVSFYAGGIVLQLAQGQKTPERRANVERRAKGYFLAALKEPGLSDHMRLRALAGLAFGLWHAKNSSEALGHMGEAAGVLAELEARPGVLTTAERTRFRWNLAVMQYQNGEVPAAAATLGKLVAIDSSQKPAATFLSKLNRKPEIKDIKTMSTEKLPPNMPIVTATVTSAGPVPVRKVDIAVEIDGKAVTFMVGPESRIYALPQSALAEGKHALKITVDAAGQTAVTATKEFDVAYKYKQVKGGGG